MSKDNGSNPPADGLAGVEAITEVMVWVQVHTQGDPDKMDDIFRTHGIDPAAFSDAADIMVTTAVAMGHSPEDAVKGAFMTGGILGAMLGRDETFLTGFGEPGDDDPPPIMEAE